MHFARRSFRFPEELSRLLEEFFLKDKTKASNSLKDLWPLLARGRGQKKEQHYSLDSRFAHAYAAYYLPANLMKIPLILEEMRLSGLPKFSGSLRWMDIGSGPGTALWGLAWWCKRYNLNFDYLALEQSRQFTKLGEELAKKLSAFHRGARAAFQLFQEKQGAKSNLGEAVTNYNPDVLCFMNSIGEIQPELTQREATLNQAIQNLAVLAKKQQRTKWLIIIEPGAKDATRELLQLRQKILAHKEIKLWLPCLDGRPCGALAQEKDWCHEEAVCEFPEWMDEIGAAAGLRKEALLFSYIVCSIGVHPTAPDNWPAQGLRMVSQRLEQKGQTECYLCTQEGKRRVRVQHSKKTPENENFFTAGRGSLFTQVETGEKGDVTRYSEAGIEKELDLILFPR